MKLHILSDLHVEFADFSPPATDADVVVLAGDIGVGSGGLEWANRSFPATPVIYVPGNHEFYHGDLQLIDELKTSAPPNMHVLDDDVVVIGDTRFIGSVLWTDFGLFGETGKFHAISRARRQMPDFRVIGNGDSVFTPEDSIRRHIRSREWIREKLSTAFAGNTVVVTHHAPSSRSVAPRFATDSLTPAFASNLETEIDEQKPALWIHGHMHDASDYEIYDTRVVCNPRGYPVEADLSCFRPDLVVRI